jgi:hypothetical protein
MVSEVVIKKTIFVIASTRCTNAEMHYFGKKKYHLHIYFKETSVKIAWAK